MSDDAKPPKGSGTSPDDKPAPVEDRPETKGPERFRPSYVFLAVVTLIFLAADLASKQWIKLRLEHASFAERKIRLIEDRLNFIYAKNRGGAWGLLQDESEAIRVPFFLAITFAAVIFIVSLYRKLEPGQRALKWGLPLVLSGALGNLHDRIRYRFVIDFIDVRITDSFTWPTFNVADIAIVVGVGLMAIDMFSSRGRAKTPRPASGPVADADEPEGSAAADTDEDADEPEAEPAGAAGSPPPAEGRGT